MKYISETPAKEVILTVYVQPRSSRNKIAGLHGEALKICITSPPVDGKANAAVTAYLAKLFHLPKSAVTITRGKQSRTKRFTITGLSFADAKKVIAQNL